MSDYRRYFRPGGTYFFTLVLEDRKQSLLTDHIGILREAFAETKKRYPFETLAICVLPDHLHWLMRLPEQDADYSIRIRLFKTLFSKRLPESCRRQNAVRKKRGELGIWQRRFWEHVIRDERDLARHMDYVYFNPVKHGYVENVADWPFSSFHRDVESGLYCRDWGSGIVQEIRDLYLE